MYVVYFEKPELSPERIPATRFRMEGEHLVFMTDDGKLVALFLLEIVKDWVLVDEDSP